MTGGTSAIGLPGSKTACDQRLQVANGVWCNWQHSGFWYRHSRFESWYPSSSRAIRVGIGS